MRFFRNREQVNKVCLMEGEMPEGEDEIAIDRMYADNNSLKQGTSLPVEKNHGGSRVLLLFLTTVPCFRITMIQCLIL